MKNIKRKSIIAILLVILISIVSVDKVKAENILCTSSYLEDDMQMMREYSDKTVMYLTLMDIDNIELVADVSVTIEYEYADGYWVQIDWIYLDVECYDGYSDSIDDVEIYHEYGVRYGRIINPAGVKIKYAIKAYADCYGETSVDYEIIDRYYD